MNYSLRAALVALLTLALVPVSSAADSESPVAQESAPVETSSDQTAQAAAPQEAPVPVPLEQAAEGVDPSAVSEEPAPSATQLPFDLKAAVDIALAAFGGEVLKADQVEDETGIHFHIRVVNDGRVRDVVIDAANGEIIKPIDVATAQPASEAPDAVTGADEADSEATASQEEQPLVDAPVAPEKSAAAKEAVQ